MPTRRVAFLSVAPLGDLAQNAAPPSTRRPRPRPRVMLSVFRRGGGGGGARRRHHLAETVQKLSGMQTAAATATVSAAATAARSFYYRFRRSERKWVQRASAGAPGPRGPRDAPANGQWAIGCTTAAARTEAATGMQWQQSPTSRHS